MDHGVSGEGSNMFDDVALPLLIDLGHQGFDLRVTGGELYIRPVDRVTSALRAQLRRHKAALVTLITICDDGVQARVARFKQLIVDAPADVVLPALVFLAGVPYVKARCFSCGDPITELRYGRCWRCSLAWRLAAGVPLPATQAAVYDDARVVA